MPDRGDEGWGEVRAGRRREGRLPALLRILARMLERSLTAGSSGSRCCSPAASSLISRWPRSLAREWPRHSCSAPGICLFARHALFGICLGGAALAFVAGFATAKLRTELVRAPVLAEELRYVRVAGFVEEHELRDKRRARLTLRVLSLGDLALEQRPYRVRVTLPASDGGKATIGEAVSLRATLRPPPEPIAPGSFDFARQAWFSSLGARPATPPPRSSRSTPRLRRLGTWPSGRASTG